MDLKKKGEIFETNNGQLIFICCICNASNVGVLEVESHLKTHIDLVLSSNCSDRDTVKSEIDYKNEIWVKMEVTAGTDDSDNNSNEHIDSLSLNNGSDRPAKMKLSKELPKKYYYEYKSVSKKFYPKFIRYSCDICNKTLSQKNKIKNHLETVHLGVRKYECNICGVKFVSPRNLAQHIDRHNNVKNYKCDECGKEFVTSTEHVLHIRAHRGERNYVCTICGRAFLTKSAFSVHTRHVHIKDRKFRCDYSGCTKTFFESYHLKVHKRTHTGERPVNCDICQKTFTNRKILRTHQLLHSNDKKYHCKYCPSKFAQSSGRRGHERRVHGAE